MKGGICFNSSYTDLWIRHIFHRMHVHNVDMGSHIRTYGFIPPSPSYKLQSLMSMITKKLPFLEHEIPRLSLDILDPFGELPPLCDEFPHKAGGFSPI